VQNPQKEQWLFVDGRKIGRAAKLAFWPIAKGHHEVQLRTANGEIVDRVPFIVR
jgi:hypothetical protein